MIDLSTERVASACARFRRFFEELEGVFFEREDVLKQVALALLAREHVLLTGPPGTAKSQLASAVFGRIVCEQSGRPSLYARQITESTVQTDLIGPVDFKRLMDTGRTEHFTDEGMLGAVHAFLDEVFDGRDMLLRTTLNMLEERELKEGTKTTRGRVEVALMTSNRYIADVIEGARDTLLAFVDRIAFVAFVPRSFADPANFARVLAKHVGQAAHNKLDALLTLEDVDVLQELAVRAHVAPEMCRALAALLGHLDEEIGAAVRADPSFVPTRYLSTRTAVRAGKILRAASVYDRIFGYRAREEQVLGRDLEMLRLHLALSGPSREGVKTLLERETNPNERRQLQIMRTEREIFERCLARVKVVVPPLTRDAPASARSPASLRVGPASLAAGPTGVPGAAAPPALDMRLAEIGPKIRSGAIEDLLAAIRMASLEARAGAPQAEAARGLLEEAVSALNARVMRAVLAPAAGTMEPFGAVESLAGLAASIGSDSVAMHAVASWLRQRALATIDELAGRITLGAAALGSTLDPGAARAASDGLLATLERLRRLRDSVTSAATAPVAHEPWRAAIAAAEDDLAALWDAVVCAAVTAHLAGGKAPPLSELCAGLRSAIDELEGLAARVSLLRRALAAQGARDGPAPGGAHRSADGARAGRRLRRFAARDRGDARRARSRGTRGGGRARRLAALGGRGAGARRRAERGGRLGLGRGDRPRWLSSAAHARRARARLLYAVHHRRARRAGRGALRQRGRARARARGRAPRGHPEGTRRRAAEVDLGVRIGRALGYLEAWWQALAAHEGDARTRLDAVVRSSFFDVIWDEAALARFGLELDVLAEALPGEAAGADAVRARIAALEARTRRGAQALLRERTDEAWAAVVRES